MISIIEATSIVPETTISKIMGLLDNEKFQIALAMAGSLATLKVVFNMYRNRRDREKYLGKSKKNKKDGIMDWNDLIQNLSDTSLLSSKK